MCVLRLRSFKVQGVQYTRKYSLFSRVVSRLFHFTVTFNLLAKRNHANASSETPVNIGEALKQVVVMATMFE